MTTIDPSGLITSPSRVFKPPTTHRTNSLGWAKCDCHTCKLELRLCDRKRPRCDACTDQGIICGGYVQPLQWLGAGRRVPKSRTTKRSAITSRRKDISDQSTSLTFIQEDGRPKKKNSKAESAELPISDEEPSNTLAPVSNSGPVLIPRHHDRPASDGDLNTVLLAHQPDFFQLPSSTLAQLAFFTWTFSSATVTYEIQANPWQACVPQINHAPFLLDAVRALAIRHRAHLENAQESLVVLELQNKALKSFANSVSTMPIEIGVSASLILIGIDYAESAFGNWTVHLRGIHKMIETVGGMQVIKGKQMHLQAQIAQVIWYDTIIALLSRRNPVFPREYAENVLSWRDELHWSFLALNGFPDAAFLEMYDIADAAAHADTLSDGHVSGLEMKLWLARFETEQGSTDKEIAALTDCWRLGLLLYCTRVFHRGRGSSEKAKTLAEEIMWLIYEIPPDSNKQKQALLPLFLAACETESFRFRRIATEFCERWKKKSGIWLNQSAVELLHKIWSAKDENPDSDVWWGNFVNPPPDSGFLFG